MCGRARCTLSPAQAARAFGFPTTAAAAAGGGGGDAPAVPTLHTERFRPSYNVSPGAYLPVGAVRAGGDGGGAEGEGPFIQCMKWGLVPSFAAKSEKPNHFRMFNARSESIKEKASFRRLIPKNRCLVAVEGFYEWKKDGPKKQPYYIHFQDQRPLVFAALFDTWTSSEGETIHTFTILTTRASASLEWLHDRMPVILGDKDSINSWLTSTTVKLEEITVPYEGADLVWYPVTIAMGKASFDDPECIKEIQIGPIEKPISVFFTKKSGSNNQSVNPEKITQEFAETKPLRTAKEECNGSGEQGSDRIEKQKTEDKQGASVIVTDEPVTPEPQHIEKTQSIKHEDIILPDKAIRKQDTYGIKRKSEDAEDGADMMESSWRPPFSPVKKKEKGPKAASDGQASLLSYFAKK